MIDGMRDGSILDRSGKEYKPSTIRSYEQAVRTYLRPRLSRHRLDKLKRKQVQALVDAMRLMGLKPSTVHNKLDPLRVVCRRAARRDQIEQDPTTELDLPFVRGRRERVFTRDRARRLLDVLPPFERALWATALYSGLRVGELRALRWRDVGFDGRKLYVRGAWDDVEGEIDVPFDAAAAERIADADEAIDPPARALQMRGDTRPGRWAVSSPRMGHCWLGSGQPDRRSFRSARVALVPRAGRRRVARALASLVLAAVGEINAAHELEQVDPLRRRQQSTPRSKCESAARNIAAATLYAPSDDEACGSAPPAATHATG